MDTLTVVNPTREQAWDTLTRYTKSEALLRHALAVEASTRWYARHFGEDEELWGVTALLHDFDYEIHPTLDKHPQDGAPILREEGYPEVVIEGVLSHAEHLQMPRDTPLKKTLFACDELSGFIHACGLVRPTGIDGLEPKSVKKKLKQPSFAAGVHRDEVYAGAELLGLELDDHIRNVIEALQPIAPELGLRTAETRRGMTPQLDAIGLVTSDMEASLAFYHLLGLEPSGEDHVEATLPGGMRLMWDTLEVIRSFDPSWEQPVGPRPDLPGVPLRFAGRGRRDVPPGRRGRATAARRSRGTRSGASATPSCTTPTGTPCSSTRRSRRPRDQPPQVVLVVPPADGCAAPAEPRHLADDDAGLERARDRPGRFVRPPGDERGVAGLGDDVDALGEEVAAARRELARPFVAASGAEPSAASSPASDVPGVHPASKRAAPGRGVKEPSGS